MRRTFLFPLAARDAAANPDLQSQALEPPLVALTFACVHGQHTPASDVGYGHPSTRRTEMADVVEAMRAKNDDFVRFSFEYVAAMIDAPKTRLPGE